MEKKVSQNHAYQPSQGPCSHSLPVDPHWFCAHCGGCVVPRCPAYMYHQDMVIPANIEAVAEGIVSTLDKQVGGDHYKKMGAYQPWEVLKHWLTPEELRGAAKMCAIKYLARERDKGGRQDIEKAVHTLQIYLELTKEGK